MWRELKDFLRQRLKAVIAAIVAGAFFSAIEVTPDFGQKPFRQILTQGLIRWLPNTIIASLVLLLFETYGYVRRIVRLLEELPEASQLARRMSDIVNGTREVGTQVTTELRTGVTYLRHFLSLNQAFRDQIQTITTGLEKISNPTYTFPPLVDYVERDLLEMVKREIQKLSEIQAAVGPKLYAQRIIGLARGGPLLITSLVNVNDLLTHQDIKDFITALHDGKAETYNLIFADRQKYESDQDYTGKLNSVKQERERPLNFHCVICRIHQQEGWKEIYVDCAITPHGMYLSNLEPFKPFSNVQFVELSGNDFGILIDWYARRFKDCFLDHCQDTHIRQKFEESFKSFER